MSIPCRGALWDSFPREKRMQEHRNSPSKLTQSGAANTGLSSYINLPPALSILLQGPDFGLHRETFCPHLKQVRRQAFFRPTQSPSFLILRGSAIVWMGFVDANWQGSGLPFSLRHRIDLPGSRTVGRSLLPPTSPRLLPFRAPACSLFFRNGPDGSTGSICVLGT